MATAELQQAVDQLIQARFNETDIESIKKGPLLLLVNATKQLPDVDKEEEVQRWRRPNSREGTKPAGGEGEDEDGQGGRKRIAVTCPSQHVLKRFNTPHPNYTCDVCKRSQRLNTTMYGCRNCNYDACVPCHGKLLSKLKQELELVQSQAEAAKPVQVQSEVAIPENAAAALLNCFGELRTDTDVCLLALECARNLAFVPANRTAALRDSVLLGTNEHIEDARIAEIGCAALHNLTCDVHDLTSEDIEGLLQVAKKVLELHANNDGVIGKAFGLLLSLHDTGDRARAIVRSANLVPSTLAAMERFSGAGQLTERGCGLLTRLSNEADCEQVLSLITQKIMTMPNAGTNVVEQAYSTAITLCYMSNPAQIIPTIAKCAQARTQT